MPHTDSEALLWLASQEGLRLSPYRDPDGKQWNIGFGHLLSYKNSPPKVRPLTTIEAWRLLKHDWNKAKSYASRAIEKTGMKPKNPGTPMALALLAYNAGPGIFTTRRFRQAAGKGEQGVLQWVRGVNTVNGKPDATLTRRRNAEVAWALSPDKHPLPISQDAKKRFLPLVEQGPQPTPTPIPEQDVPGEAPARFNPEADMAVQEGDDNILMKRFNEINDKWQSMRESTLPEQPMKGEAMAETEKAGGQKEPWWKKEFIPNPVTGPFKALFNWLTDNNREEAEKIAQKYGLDLNQKTPTPTPTQSPSPTPAQAEEPDNLIQDYSPQAGETRPSGGGEGANIIHDYDPSLSPGGSEYPETDKEREDRAYSKWLKEQAQGRMKYLDKEANRLGARSEGLRKKLMQRTKPRYENPYE